MIVPLGLVKIMGKSQIEYLGQPKDWKNPGGDKEFSSAIASKIAIQLNRSHKFKKLLKALYRFKSYEYIPD